MATRGLSGATAPSKENFASTDGREVLDRLAAIPVATWNYKSEDPSIRHIGPVAQDFYAAFGVGEDDKHIATIDADGVALAAIQGLYRVVQEQDARIAGLEARLASQEAANADLDARLSRLEQRGPRAGLPGGWLVFGGLVAAAAVGGRRLAGGGR